MHHPSLWCSTLLSSQRHVSQESISGELRYGLAIIQFMDRLSARKISLHWLGPLEQLKLTVLYKTLDIKNTHNILVIRDTPSAFKSRRHIHPMP